jgi:pyruvate carboxylase subunit B
MADIPGRNEEPLVDFHVDGTDYKTRLTRKVRERAAWRPTDRSKVTTLIPGVIVEVLVRPGQRLERGDGVVVLEAMKMRNEVQSPWDGTVREILVEVGQNVPKGAVLVELV